MAPPSKIFTPCPECGSVAKWRERGQAEFRCLPCDPPRKKAARDDSSPMDLLTHAPKEPALSRKR